MRRADGFTLIEVLVALALAGAILLIAGGFYWQQFVTSERLEAARRADLALENAYEELRAGALPLESGPLATTADGVTLEALVAPSGTDRLTDLTLVARYELRGKTRTRELAARVYRP